MTTKFMGDEAEADAMLSYISKQHVVEKSPSVKPSPFLRKSMGVSVAEIDAAVSKAVQEMRRVIEKHRYKPDLLAKLSDAMQAGIVEIERLSAGGDKVVLEAARDGRERLGTLARACI